MRIGIIGAGMIGSTVGRLFAAAGHEVRFATRHPERLADLVAEIGATASQIISGSGRLLSARTVRFNRFPDVPLHAIDPTTCADSRNT